MIPSPTPTPSFKISLQNEALCALKVPPELSLQSALLKGNVFTHVIALRQLQPVPPLPLPPPPSLRPSLPPSCSSSSSSSSELLSFSSHPTRWQCWPRYAQVFPNRIRVDLHCFSPASFWDHFYLAFSTGVGDLDGTGPGGVGLGVRERACGGKGRGREEEEHNSPVRASACLWPGKQITRQAGSENRGSVMRPGTCVLCRVPADLTGRQGQIWGFPQLELFSHCRNGRLKHRG